MVQGNPLTTRTEDSKLAAFFVTQLRAPETPEPVRDLPDADVHTLAHTLATVARRAGWAPGWETLEEARQ